MICRDSAGEGGAQHSSESMAAEENRIVELTNVSATRDSSLQFLDVPKGDDMRIHDLKLNEEYLLFEAFSQLMGYLQPTGFPSGMSQ